jgi:hypothetical protein
MLKDFATRQYDESTSNPTMQTKRDVPLLAQDAAFSSCTSVRGRVYRLVCRSVLCAKPTILIVDLSVKHHHGTTGWAGHHVLYDTYERCINLYDSVQEDEKHHEYTTTRT